MRIGIFVFKGGKIQSIKRIRGKSANLALLVYEPAARKQLP